MKKDKEEKDIDDIDLTPLWTGKKVYYETFMFEHIHLCDSSYIHIYSCLYERL